MKPSDLILASQSPRRRQLLERHGYHFRVVLPRETAECGICSQETPPEQVSRLALQKARDVAERVDEGIVLACDTLVECRGQTLGKPVNREHARQMLNLLSGQVHAVYSGVSLWRRPDDRRMLDVAVSRLQMETLTPQQLDEYLDSEQWEGKAGAFGYQDGHDWLQLTEGSESNVVGLPMELVDTMLKKLLTE